MRRIQPNKFAKEINVSAETLKAWDRTGYLPAKRTNSNRRYYTDSCINAYFKNVYADKIISELSLLTKIMPDLLLLNKYPITCLPQEYIEPSTILFLVIQVEFVERLQNTCSKNKAYNESSFPRLHELFSLYSSNKTAYKEIIDLAISKLQKMIENTVKHETERLTLLLSRNHKNITPSLLIPLNNAYNHYEHIIGLNHSDLSEVEIERDRIRYKDLCIPNKNSKISLYLFDREKCINFIYLKTKIKRKICAEFVEGEDIYRISSESDLLD